MSLMHFISLLYQICRGLSFRVRLTPLGSNFYYDNAFTYRVLQEKHRVQCSFLPNSMMQNTSIIVKTTSKGC